MIDINKPLELSNGVAVRFIGYSLTGSNIAVETIDSPRYRFIFNKEGDMVGFNRDNLFHMANPEPFFGRDVTLRNAEPTFGRILYRLVFPTPLRRPASNFMYGDVGLHDEAETKYEFKAAVPMGAGDLISKTVETYLRENFGSAGEFVGENLNYGSDTIVETVGESTMEGPPIEPDPIAEATAEAIQLVKDMAGEGDQPAPRNRWRKRARDIVAKMIPIAPEPEPEEPSEELMLARNLVAGHVLHDHGGDEAASYTLIGVDNKPVTQGSAVYLSKLIRAGEVDHAYVVQNALELIRAGRALGESATPPVERERPDRLTITVDGPQGSGVSTLANYLAARMNFFFGPPAESNTRLDAVGTAFNAMEGTFCGRRVTTPYQVIDLSDNHG